MKHLNQEQHITAIKVLKMSKFLIKQLDTSAGNIPNFNVSANLKQICTNQKTLSLELLVLEWDLNSIEKLNTHFKYNKPVKIESCEYDIWVEPFKKEFKEFLEEKYPDKILSDPKGFEIMFGK